MILGRMFDKIYTQLSDPALEQELLSATPEQVDAGTLCVAAGPLSGTLTMHVTTL